MDFRFDEEQLALRDAVRAWCKGQADLADVAAREQKPVAGDIWSGLAGLGVFGMLLPAERGGFGGGAVEAALVFEQLGAHLVAGPVLWSTISAPLVADVHTGAVRVTGLEVGAATNESVVIEHAADSDIVVMVYEDRVERCAASEVGDPLPGTAFDPLTPMGAYARPPHGEVIGGGDDAQRLRLVGTVLASAMLLGVAQGALDVASNYALERQQFGVPIGSFQAIKHLLADMFVRTELARSATYAAAAIVDHGRADEAANATSTAKLLAGDAGIANGRTSVQVLGGMGFTWEMLPHYFLKRAWVLEHAFGTGDRHALALGDAVTMSAWT